MTIQDWRDVSPDVMRPLYDAEQARWASSLGWDFQPTATIAEAARVRGELPGLVVWDRAAVAGWAFYVVSQGLIQIGGVVARRASVARDLLGAILDSSDAAHATGISCFAFPSSPALASALVRLRFEVRRQLYLAQDLRAPEPALPTPMSRSAESVGLTYRSWSPDDAAETVRLLARSYAGSPAGRCFAPSGQLDEWVHYVRGLLGTGVCGTLAPFASLVVGSADTPRPVGGVLTTVIDPETAHIAQVAVDPDWRGRRIGEHLIRSAGAAARDAGYRRLTLIVDEHNQPARALYDRLGFTPHAEFVYASRARPTRRILNPRASRRAA